MGTEYMRLEATNSVVTGSTRGSLRTLLGGCALLIAAALPATAHVTVSRGPAPAAATRVQGDLLKYVLAGDAGATLRNLPDPKGRDVLKVARDTPLAVYAEREGYPYLRVAVPGGVKVWVFGKYLTESARLGWVDVAGSFINMRPLPQTQHSFPLGQLDRGDRLRFIKRQDTSKPMDEDWVQVYSPPDTMVYVLASEIRALPDGSDPAALWSAAVDKALGSQPEVKLPTDAGAGTAQPASANSKAAGANQASGVAGSDPGVFAKLALANTAMQEGLASGSADYGQLLANYQELLAMGPDSSTRSMIEERIKRLELHRELAQMREEYEQESQGRKEQLEGLRDQADQNRRGHDPLWGRFQTRGWLEKQIRDGEKIYLVRWGAEFLAQVQCSSRRYDLDLYDGFEIGVQGAPVSSARVDRGTYPLLDIDRIEVISARLRER